MAETKTTIANLALGMVGISALHRLTDVDTDDTQAAAAVRNVYDRLRKDELRKNNWVFTLTRRVLRANAADDVIVAPSAYAAGTTYAKNDLALYSDLVYISLRASNVGNTPDISPTYWEPLSGPLIAKDFDADLSYFRHELVVDSGNTTWIALVNSPDTSTDPVEGDDWHEVSVSAHATIYRTPLSGRLYSFTLPDDYLRMAPRDPKISQVPTDWLIETGMLLSDTPGPLVLRYVRDEKSPVRFDANFVTALAARVARDICEELTQSSGKKRDAQALYADAIADAKRSSAIEQGPEEPDTDEWEWVRR